MPETAENNAEILRLNEQRKALIEQFRTAYARTVHAAIDSLLSVPASQRPAVLKVIKDALWEAGGHRDNAFAFKDRHEFMEEMVTRTLARSPGRQKKGEGELVSDYLVLDRDIFENMPKVGTELMWRTEQDRALWKSQPQGQQYLAFIKKAADFLQQVDLADEKSRKFVLTILHRLKKVRLGMMEEEWLQAMIDEDVVLELLSGLEKQDEASPNLGEFTPAAAQELQSRIKKFVAEISAIHRNVQDIIKEMDRKRSPF